jgi:uncharacterized integral membrane protein
LVFFAKFSIPRKEGYRESLGVALRGVVLNQHYHEFDHVYTKENDNIYNGISVNIVRSTMIYIFIVHFFDMVGVNIVVYEFSRTWIIWLIINAYMCKIIKKEKKQCAVHIYLTFLLPSPARSDGS